MRAILVAASLLLASIAVAPAASANPLGSCVGEPGAVAVCSSTEGGLSCTTVGVGLQGVKVCRGLGGASVCVGFNCYGIQFG